MRLGGIDIASGKQQRWNYKACGHGPALKRRRNELDGHITHAVGILGDDACNLAIVHITYQIRILFAADEGDFVLEPSAFECRVPAARGNGGKAQDRIQAGMRVQCPADELFRE